MRTHLTYRNFDRRLLDATDTLFSQAPWRSDDADVAARIGQEWVDAASSIYGVPTPVLHIDRSAAWPFELASSSIIEDVDGTPNGVAGPTIVMPKWSITNLFGAFRTYVLETGAVMARPGSPSNNRDAWEWATSLFYAIKPVMFRARCREGRIVVVDPTETFSHDTLEQLSDIGLLDELSAFGPSREWRNKVDAFLAHDNESTRFDTEPSEAPQTPAEARNEGLDPVPTGDYNDLDVTALRRLASQRDVARAWRQSKDENIAALRAQDRTHVEDEANTEAQFLASRGEA